MLSPVGHMHPTLQQKKRKLPESEVVEAVKDMLDDNTDIVALE